jgi:hypothetical protein
MADSDLITAAFERCLPMKTGQLASNPCLPVAGSVGGTAAEVDLTALLVNSPGCYITVEVRSNGPLYIGMNKKATSATTLTAGTGSLGEKISLGDQPRDFWVSSYYKFCEVIADVANTAYVIRRSNSPRSVRRDVGANTPA